MASAATWSLLKKALMVDFGIQGAGFLVAAALKTEKFYDLAGSGTVLLMIYKSMQWGRASFARQKIQSSCAALWAARLGMFLFTRILKDGHDRRFNKIKHDPKMFFVAWTMQGMWVFANLLPTLIQNSKQRDTPIGTKEYIGWAMWALGFLMQIVADSQKSAFRADPANAGKFISTGLWSLSRHPNYFGEIMMWSGLYLSAFNTLQGWEHSAIISPLFSTFILTQVSGIPMLEKSGMKRWGSDPDYQKYLREVPSLIPSLSRMFK